MLDNNKKQSGNLNFKSPLRKVAHFLLESRDRWKAKSFENKRLLKNRNNKIRYMEKRMNELKNKVKELELELELRRRSPENTNLPVERPMEDFHLRPAYHTYSVGHICLSIWNVLKAGVSLRASSRIFETINSYFGLNQPVPSWYTVRLWLLRLGYYKLHRIKELADDWIWIVDHTGLWGLEKGLLILGIRQSRLPAGELYLNFEDVEPIALFPVRKSNGEIVYEQLKQAAEKTGIPREIVGDHGPDIKSGIERFCRENGHTCYIYDITHKAAAILKRELKDDPDWNDYIKKCSQTSRQVQQTSLAGFGPPNQRSKARYMNVNKLINWGSNILVWLDQRDEGTQEEQAQEERGQEERAHEERAHEERAHEERAQEEQAHEEQAQEERTQEEQAHEDGSDEYDSTKIDEKLGWLEEYRDHLAEWRSLAGLVDSTSSFIKFLGIYNGCHIDLENELLISSNSEWIDRVRGELLAFVKDQSAQANGDERLLGSSEIIESVFGKYKDMIGDQVKGGFTAMLLGLPALLSTTTREDICEAIENTSTENVLEWYRKNIGGSLQSQRKKILKTVREAEQKRAEKMCLDPG